MEVNDLLYSSTREEARLSCWSLSADYSESKMFKY